MYAANQIDPMVEMQIDFTIDQIDFWVDEQQNPSDFVFWSPTLERLNTCVAQYGFDRLTLTYFWGAILAHYSKRIGDKAYEPQRGFYFTILEHCRTHLGVR